MAISKKSTSRILMYLLSVAICASHATHADEKPHWGYTGDAGPEYWGRLSVEFTTCSSGKNQSPINLANMIEAELAEIAFDYRSVPLRIVNNGHTLQVNCPKGGRITVDGHSYNLLQFHFHSPSENQINGRSFPLEAHLVHSDDHGKLAVIAVMFYAGHKANQFLDTIWKYMPTEVGRENLLAHVNVNAMVLLPRDTAYYRYSGSLTTPPCSEGVLWMVMKNAVEVSSEQVEAFRALMGHANNRPIQPIFSRAVLQ